MAVEAPHNHMNLFPSQLLINTNREMMKPNHHNLQFDGANVIGESHLPLYQYSTGVCDLNSINRADSSLTCHIPIQPFQRKRSIDSIIESNVLPNSQKPKLSSNAQSTFPDQHLFYHLQNHQSEIDRLISQHTEKVRMELEEQRMRQSRTLLCVIQEAVMKKLKEKDDEIQRMGKLNWALQERVKTLCLENQVWREMAQTNEATANSLRTNLEQVLAHVSDDHRHGSGEEEVAESVCSSNHVGGEEKEEEEDSTAGRMCKQCGERESIVLLLPCRHLCLCTMCGSTIRECPICHSGINASVHVNFS